MGNANERHWLSDLPFVGCEAIILFKDGHAKTFGSVRMSREEKILKIDILEMGNKETIPTISKTQFIHEDDISAISYLDERTNEVRYFRRRGVEWLKDLPRSTCSVTVFCEDDDRQIGVAKGWIKTDQRKIYITEIIASRIDPLTRKKVLEIEHHEREINEVNSIMIMISGGSPQIFAPL